ncbi:MAG: Wzz/FepE/Etk N-terminal domain-containing protein [Acidibacillus sp.]|nr:Wzz/FepE/Etk N-terminal domain-containing protein [Acidibacillus sp.]
MELKEYWAVIRRWLWMIGVITIVATVTSAVLSYKVIKPTYEATTSLLVNQRYNSQTTAISALYNDTMANEALVQTYSDIIKSNTILDSVISSDSLPYTVAQLASMVKVTSNNQSEVISVSVDNPSIQNAVMIANSIAQVFQQRVVQLMQVQNVQVVDQATVPAHPVPISPKKGLNIAIAFILGLMVSVGIAFMIEYLDDTVRTEEQVTQIFGVSVLGVIPSLGTEHKGKKGRTVTQGESHGASL